MHELRRDCVIHIAKIGPRGKRKAIGSLTSLDWYAQNRRSKASPSVANTATMAFDDTRIHQYFNEANRLGG